MPADGKMLEIDPAPFDDVGSQTMPSDISDDPAAVDASEASDATTELVFVDTHLRDYQALLDGLAEDQPGREFEVILLDDAQDGIEQISEELSTVNGVDAIHILSHGGRHGLQLGSSWLRMENLEAYADDLSHWGQSLAADADLLLYGCNLAGSDHGQSLLTAIGHLTGTDVAASTDNTGHSDHGGDWQLEFTDGTVETTIAIGLETQQAWDRLMATIDVTTTDDVVNGDTTSVAALIANPGADGISLREAILATNADSGSDTINLMAGVYRLAITGDSVDPAATGDLGITDDVTIIGEGAESTFIDGDGIDRVLHVVSHSASLSDLTIRGGNNTSDGKGGGIYNQSILTLSDVIVRDNQSLVGEGGGIYDDGLTFIQHSAIINNEAQQGGGIYQSPTSVSSLTIIVSTISGNTATGSGGGLFDGNGANLNAVTVAFNSATDGGGIHATGVGTAIFNTIIASNDAGTGTDVSGTIQSSGTNLIGVSAGGSGYHASDLRDLEARLDPALTANAGSTPAHQLYSDSPAVDAATLAGTPLIDQSHLSRLIDGDGDTSEEVDIGAVEYRPLDPNSPPQDIDLSNSSVSEGTDTTGGYSVGMLTATDPDAPEAFAFQVVGGADELSFRIGGVGDELILDDGVLNLGTQPSYEVIVRVTDAEGNYYEELFTVDVTAANLPPTVSLANIASVAENADTTNSIKVADIWITDDGLGTSDLRLTGDDKDLFEIVNDTELHLKAGVDLDFESQPSLVVAVEVDDPLVGSTPDDSELAIITITDVNEPANVAVVNVLPISENVDNSSSVKVADIEVNDDLLGSNMLSISGDDAAVFVIVNSTELHIRAHTILNYEVQSSFDVTISVDDPSLGGTPDDAVDFTLNLVDENEAPTMAPEASFRVTENTADVVVVTAVDPEGDTIHYSVSGGEDRDLFTVDQNTGLVSFDPPPDYEHPADSNGDNIYHVQITATDVSSGLTATQMLTVTVNPTNDVPPVFVSNSTVVIIAGNTDVLVVQATDGDLPSSPITYAIVGGPDDGAFQLNAKTGELQFTFVPSANYPQDVDANNIYEVVVRADDNQGGSAFQLIRVLVRPDPPPVVTDDSYAVGNDGTLIVDAAMGVLADDYDPDGKSLQAHVHQQPLHGHLVLRSDGSFAYVPDIDFVGDDVFTYVARDEQGNVTIGTVTIEVTASSGPSLEEDEGEAPVEPRPPEVTPTEVGDPLPKAAPFESIRDEQMPTTHAIVRPEAIDTITFLQPIELAQLTRTSNLANSYVYTKSTESDTSMEERSGYDLTDTATYPLLASTIETWEQVTLIDQRLPLELNIRDVSAGSAAAYVLGGASVGYYLFWLIRSGSIMSTLMTPAWSIMDPLPVLNCVGDLSRNDDDETLESLISKSSPAED